MLSVRISRPIVRAVIERPKVQIRLRRVDVLTNGLQHSDARFEQPFLQTNTVNVEHNLGKRPNVQVIDSAGSQFEGDVKHTNTNQLTVTFEAAFSGTVICS